MATYLFITILTFIVWHTRGFYSLWGVISVISFLAWVYQTICSQTQATAKVRNLFYKYLPILYSLLLVSKPPLGSVPETHRIYHRVFRWSSLTTLLSFEKILPWLVLIYYFCILFLSPNPHIDVYQSNLIGVDFLLHHLNPYSQIYPDIYAGAFDYKPGYLYWPGALYLQTLSKLVFKDIRAATLLVWWVAAFFIPREHDHRSQLQKVWWLLPFAPFGFEQAWLDPILSGFAALTLWSIHKKNYMLLATAIATAASIKQYGFILGGFSIFYFINLKKWKITANTLLVAALIFFIIMAPMLFWNPSDFISITLLSHSKALPRNDALNFTALWMRVTGYSFSSIFQALFTLLGFLLACFHIFKNHTLKGIAVVPESWVIAFGFSMLFGKFAFCNYYWLLISFLLMSVMYEVKTSGADKSPS